jgi:hypothetical protein
MALRALWQRDPVTGAVQDDRRHRDRRLRGELLLDRIEAWIARCEAEAVAIGLDHHLDKIRVVEGCRGPLEGGVVEMPVRRSVSRAVTVLSATVLIYTGFVVYVSSRRTAGFRLVRSRLVATSVARLPTLTGFDVTFVALPRRSKTRDSYLGAALGRPSGANQTLGTRLGGLLSTLSGHSAQRTRSRLPQPPDFPEWGVMRQRGAGRH